MTLTPEQEAEIRANDAEFYADEIEPDSMMEQELAVNQHLLLAKIDRLRAKVERLAFPDLADERALADELAEAGDKLRRMMDGTWKPSRADHAHWVKTFRTA